MLVGILVVPAQFNIEISHMLAGLGIAGFIGGFALQDVPANFASGIMTRACRPYDVGDWIEVPDRGLPGIALAHHAARVGAFLRDAAVAQAQVDCDNP